MIRKSASEQKKKRSWSSLFLQLGVAAVIGVVFVLYVWLIQINYEEVLSANKGKHDWHTALLFGLVIFAGSFSYDCAKKVVLLNPETFAVFWRFLKEGLLDIVLMYILFFVGAALFKFDFNALGLLSSVAALFFEFSAMNNFTRALEKAAE